VFTNVKHSSLRQLRTKKRFIATAAALVYQRHLTLFCFCFKQFKKIWDFDSSVDHKIVPGSDLEKKSGRLFVFVTVIVSVDSRWPKETRKFCARYSCHNTRSYLNTDPLRRVEFIVISRCQIQQLLRLRIVYIGGFRRAKNTDIRFD